MVEDYQLGDLKGYYLQKKCRERGNIFQFFRGAIFGCYLWADKKRSVHQSMVDDKGVLGGLSALAVSSEGLLHLAVEDCYFGEVLDCGEELMGEEVCGDPVVVGSLEELDGRCGIEGDVEDELGGDLLEKGRQGGGWEVGVQPFVGEAGSSDFDGGWNEWVDGGSGVEVLWEADEAFECLLEDDSAEGSVGIGQTVSEEVACFIRWGMATKPRIDCTQSIEVALEFGAGRLLGLRMWHEVLCRGWLKTKCSVAFGYRCAVGHAEADSLNGTVAKG